MIQVGYARRAHGVGGEVAVRPMTDDPERWVAGAVFITDEEPSRALEAASVRPHGDDLLVRFTEIIDRDAAEALRGVTFHIEATDRRSLDEGEYWPDQLVGCVVLRDATELGTVADVEFGAGQDRLVVDPGDGRRIEVPLVDAIVEEIDLEARVVRMTPPEGLF